MYAVFVVTDLIDVALSPCGDFFSFFGLIACCHLESVAVRCSGGFWREGGPSTWSVMATILPPQQTANCRTRQEDCMRPVSRLVVRDLP